MKEGIREVSLSKNAIGEFILSLNKLKKEGRIENKEIIGIVKNPQDHLMIPVSVFSSNDAPFETLCNYLKDKFNFSIKEISSITKRDSKSIYTTLSNSKGKHSYAEEGILVPLEVFCQRKTSILESLCLYLAEKKELGITEIGRIISKSPKTVWTAIHRAEQKRGCCDE